MNKALEMGLDAHDREHGRVWSTLPWFVNGTLNDDECRDVETHLSVCLVCRREAAALRALAEAVASRTLEPKCEAALDRLHERLDDTSRPGLVFPWAGAAVLAVITGLAGLVAVNTGLVGSGAQANVYNTLGVRTIEVLDDARPKARIVFDQDMTEWQLRELLLAVDAELIDGPTPRGAYTIAMPHVSRSEDVRAAVAKLRQSNRVIFVEPIVAVAGQRGKDGTIR